MAGAWLRLQGRAGPRPGTVARFPPVFSKLGSPQAEQGLRLTCLSEFGGQGSALDPSCRCPAWARCLLDGAGLYPPRLYQVTSDSVLECPWPRSPGCGGGFPSSPGAGGLFVGLAKGTEAGEPGAVGGTRSCQIT